MNLPQKIGRYILLESLGYGGMCEVYRAIALGAGKFHKQVAIKKVLPQFAEDDQLRMMFEYEATLASRLNHSNIVEIYDFEGHGDLLILAMEYVEGKNLRQIFSILKTLRKPCDPAFSLFVIGEVCKGLSYAHTLNDVSGEPLNIVHRDISPENIMISFDGGVKIVDFGIARASDRIQMTKSNIVKGKLSYLAPEQITGRAADQRTDILALSLVLYEMLTGVKAFPGDNVKEALETLELCEIAPPTQRRSDLQPEIEELILKGLKKNPAERFQTAADFQREIQILLSRFYTGYIQRDLANEMEAFFPHEQAEGQKRWKELYQRAVAQFDLENAIETGSWKLKSEMTRKETTAELLPFQEGSVELPVKSVVRPPPVIVPSGSAAAAAAAATAPVAIEPDSHSEPVPLPEKKYPQLELASPSPAFIKQYREVVRLLEEEKSGHRSQNSFRVFLFQIIRYLFLAVIAGMVILYVLHNYNDISRIVSDSK